MLDDNGPAVIQTPSDLDEMKMASYSSLQLVRESLEDNPDPAAVLSRLFELPRPTDSLLLAAHLLPIRQAVWWGCLCVWHAAKKQPSPAEDAALIAAVRWVQDPLAEQVSRANQTWRPAGLKTPAGCCARAAVFAGSYAGDNEPFKPFKIRGAAKLIAATAEQALGQAKSNGVAASREQLLHFACSVAKNETKWTKDPETKE